MHHLPSLRFDRFCFTSWCAQPWTLHAIEDGRAAVRSISLVDNARIIFHKYDVNHNNRIDMSELRELLIPLSVELLILFAGTRRHAILRVPMRAHFHLHLVTCLSLTGVDRRVSLGCRSSPLQPCRQGGGAGDRAVHACHLARVVALVLVVEHDCHLA